MRFDAPLQQGTFLKRSKRFFADIRLESGEVITAHVPNTGSLKTALFPESPCLFSLNDDPKRKLKATLEMVKAPESWVGVNTQHPNRLAEEAFNEGVFAHWRAFNCMQREVAISKETRFDLVLWTEEEAPEEGAKPSKLKLTQGDWPSLPLHFVEVKNVTMVREGMASFPDAVTTRGQKHLRELTELVKKGFTAEILFVIQRTDATAFCPAADIDPTYARLLAEAAEAGVRVTPALCELGSESLRLTGEELKIDEEGQSLQKYPTGY